METESREALKSVESIFSEELVYQAQVGKMLGYEGSAVVWADMVQ